MFQSFKFLFLVAALVVMATWFISLPTQSTQTNKVMPSHEVAQTVQSARPIRLNEDPIVRLKRLLKHHPVASVREEFKQKTDTGEIMVNWWPIEGAAAVFTVLPRSRFPDLPGDAPFVKTLNINPRSFSSKSDGLLMLVLYHEFIHERQYTTGTIPPETFLRIPITTADQERQIVEQKWYAEREAYQEECRMAKRLGLESELGGLCAFVDTPKFDAVLARQLIAGERSPIAREVFARLGGISHP